MTTSDAAVASAAPAADPAAAARGWRVVHRLCQQQGAAADEVVDAIEAQQRQGDRDQMRRRPWRAISWRYSRPQQFGTLGALGQRWRHRRQHGMPRSTNMSAERIQRVMARQRHRQHVCARARR